MPAFLPDDRPCDERSEHQRLVDRVRKLEIIVSAILNSSIDDIIIDGTQIRISSTNANPTYISEKPSKEELTNFFEGIKVSTEAD